MIDEPDKKRLRYGQEPTRYIVTSYRQEKDLDDTKYAEDYDLFYQIKVDDEIILSVFRRKRYELER